jgi:hypothetical protein
MNRCGATRQEDQMILENVSSENGLRNWLTDNLHHCEGRITVEWIEPAPYGSTEGAPDCKLKSEGMTVDLELKFLLSTKKGIKWTVRPAQRRYLHMSIKNGNRSALLAFIAATEELHLIRGDHVPLRDYAKDPSSGCAHGLVKMNHIDYFSVDRDRQAMFNLESILFQSPLFWTNDDKPGSKFPVLGSW